MDRSRLRRYTLLLVLVAALVLLVGCADVGDEDEPDVESQLADAEPPEELTATLETEATFGNESIELSEDVWLRADGTSRSESELNGTPYVTVDDGERVWSHDQAENRVTVYDADETDGNRLEAGYEAAQQLFAELDAERTTETTLEGHDVYHVVLEPSSDESIERSINVLVGETVYALPVGSGADDAEADLSDGGAFQGTEPERLEFWLDTEHLFPVKYRFETDENAFQMTYSDLEFEPDPPLDDDRFEFEVPPNATVEELELPTFEEYDDLDEVDAAVAFDVSEPDLPDGYERERISVGSYEDENRTQVSLTYTDGADGSLSVEFTDDTERFDREGESVEIGSATGTYDRIEVPDVDLHSVTWTCDGVGHYVGTTVDVDRETLLDVAASVGCS